MKEDEEKGVMMLEDIINNGTFTNTAYYTLYKIYNKDKKYDDCVRICDKAIDVLDEACAKCNDLIKCHGGCRLQAMLDNSGDIWSCDKIMCDYYSSNVNKKVRETISKIFEVS